jgi:chromosome segregation ATPase
MRRKLPLLLLLLCASLPLQTQAAEESVTAEIISLEIRNLSSSVDRLTRLIYDQTQLNNQDRDLRKLDIAVAYLNFRSRRIEQLERDKQRSVAAKTRLEDVINQWEQRIELFAEQAANNQGVQHNTEQAKQEAQEQLKMLKQRLTRVDTDLLEYDNKIVELQTQLDSIEAFVERHLELQ